MTRSRTVVWKPLLQAMLCAGLASWSASLSAAERLDKLEELSLEELMNVRVSLASRRPEALSQTAAAAFVLGREEIRRSGATTIAEALRLVPGMQVARSDANKWAISARGFNGLFSNKLLVLIDGRSAYTTTFSGVFWNIQDVLLEDVEQIEVIRGPGATLWGANAVNGIVNVVTRGAQETQGNLVETGMGTEERGFVNVRHGGKLGRDAYFRVYGMCFDRDQFVDHTGKGAEDGWNGKRGGFRVDWHASQADELMLQGGILTNDVINNPVLPTLHPPFKQRFVDPTDVTGTNLLGRWRRDLSPSSNLALQLYYDWSKHVNRQVGERRHTFDLDFQHRLKWGAHRELVWGCGYRLVHDRLNGSFVTSFSPESRNMHLLSAFVQQESRWLDDRLRAILGSKFERNSFTGLEVQPSARLLWNPDPRQVIWMAASRAVKLPSRVDNDVRMVIETMPPDPSSGGTLPVIFTVFGNREVAAEELRALEVGYRLQLLEQAYLDLATFCNWYDGLVSAGRLGTPYVEASPPPEHAVLPLPAENALQGRTNGLELATDWQVLDRWHLRAAYTYLHVHLEGNGFATFTVSAAGTHPEHQVTLYSRLNLPGKWLLDGDIRYVSGLKIRKVDGYAELNGRLSRHLTEQLELAVVGQNLLHAHHSEFVPIIVSLAPAEVQRGVYGVCTWRF